MRRRDRTPTITVRGDIADDLQPPDVSTAVLAQLQPVIDKLPGGYRIETAGAIEESDKATVAMLPLFPIMLAITLLIIIFRTSLTSGQCHGKFQNHMPLMASLPELLTFLLHMSGCFLNPPSIDCTCCG